MHVAVLSAAVVPTVCGTQVRPGKHKWVFLDGVRFLCQDLLGICKISRHPQYSEKWIFASICWKQTETI